MITTLGEWDAPVGLTVNSFSSVSLDPPLILWSLSLTAPSFSAFQHHDGFAVNIMSADAKDIVQNFARPSPNKFADVTWRLGYLGVPLLDQVVATFECRTESRIIKGDHAIYIGRVERHTSTDREPLVFHRGSFTTLGAPPLNAGAATFGVVIAGFGWWGQHIARRLADHADIRVVGVAEPDAARHSDIEAAGLERFDRLDAALVCEDVDAVILTTPNLLHEEQVIQCARAGKHVFCEKPLGLTAASAKRSVAACKEAGVQLGIGHERRFETAMQALKRAIDAGDLGTVMHAEAAFSHDKLIHVPKGDWRTLKATAPAAAMTGMGIHLTDLLISFFGRVETVQAMTSDRSLGWETGDVVTVQLGFVRGMTAVLSAILHTPHFIRMHVFGSAKWIEIRNATHPDTPGGEISYVEAVSGTPPFEQTYGWNDAVVANLEAFRRAAIGEAAYPFTLDEMVHNIEVLEAITLSASDRRTVRIDSL